MIRVIAGREARALFRSPLAWSLLAIAQFVLAYQFLIRIEFYTEFADKLRLLPEAPGITELVVSPLFGTSAVLLLFLAPLITMNTISGERRNGSLALLLSSPVNAWQIVCGKFLGACSLLAVLIGLIALMPLSLLWGTRLDLGLYSAGVGALLMLGAAYTAIGVMYSTLCTQATLAAVLAIGTLASLWILDWATRLGEDGGLFSYLSTLNHFQELASGVVSLRDLAYFSILTIFALTLSVWRLHGDRKPL